MALWTRFLARPTQTPISSRPSLTLFFLLVGAFLLTLVPQAVHFPTWLSVVIAGAMILRSFIEAYRLSLPSTTFCGILAIVLFGVIYAQYGTIMGRDAGTAFTAGLLTIKFYELRRPRDVALIIFSSFFVVMSALLYDQYLELFIYCLIMMWVLTSLLLRVHTGDLHQDHLIRMLGKSGIIFVQALPLALCLFFFFPRYTGKLSFSLDEAKIGITDTVSPGSIAKLSRDDTVAMYVYFKSRNAPAIDSMYWRALVLWDYRDGTWTPGQMAGALQSRKYTPSGDPYEYDQDIIVKTHNQRWLFALDVPVTRPINPAESPSWAALLNGNIVQMTQGKLNHMAHYTIFSSSAPIEEELKQVEYIDGTRLPDSPTDHIDQRVKDLADQLYANGSEQSYILAVLEHFRSGSFRYTTEPGVQGADWLPVFLFQTKRGFCEHFASAFAILMRIKHIPARVVVGYRGADYNPYSDDYVVSQSDAHAWNEVWIPSDHSTPQAGQIGRWVRIDPTAPVATIGSMPAPTDNSGAQDDLGHQVSLANSGSMEDYLPVWMKEGLRVAQLRREQVEANWDNLVLSYDPETQFRLAAALGFGAKAPAGLFLTCAIAALFCGIVFRKWMLRKETIPPVENLYAAFCYNMARRGIPRATWEGPLAYTDRVAEAFPDDKPALQQVGDIVARARYGPIPADAAAHDNLKSLLTVLTASQAASKR